MEPSQSDLEAIRRLLADLTHRVYRIEQRLQIDAGAPEPPASTAQPTHPPPQPPAPVVQLANESSYKPVPQPVVRPAAARTEPEIDLESRIGSHWLNRIGIAAVLIGISYFLKFAFENNWIGPAGRVAIGLVAGIAIILWSERFRLKGYKAFSYSLKAVGIGTLYLSLWAAFQRYSLIPSSVAFFMMLLVTASAAAMALAQDAEILAAFALTGGFATPFLVSTGENREIALFSYVAILDLATLVLVKFKPWRRLLVMSYLGTLGLYVGWYSEFYHRFEYRYELQVTIAFATVFFAIFAFAPLFTLQPKGENPVFAAIPAILAFVNAGVYFLEVYDMMESVDKTSMAWFALALAAVYIFLSRQVHARELTPGTTEILYFLHLAVAIGFITVAIPIRLNAHWITVGWFVEAAVLLWIGNRVKSDFLNVFALGALAMGVVRLLLIDNFVTTDQLIFNMRMATYAVAVAVLGIVAWYAGKREDEAAKSVAAVSLVALNLLALIALTREVADYFSRQAAGNQLSPGNWKYSYSDLHRIDIERDFTFSALWMAYGAMLMVIGFLRRSAFVRWQALILIAFTIGKVFIYDFSELDRAYRIVSFMILGVLLLAISFVYQRDWLKLSNKNRAHQKSEGSTPGA